MSTASRLPLFSVSVRRLPLMRLGECLRRLESVGVSELQVDVFDGTFAPGFALGFEVIEALREATALPIHAHLRVERPERYISNFARLGCAALTVPIETCTHAYRIITQIRESGMKSGASVDPGTALTKLEYVLPLLDRVVLPVDYHTDAEIPAAAFERVRILRENVEYHNAGAQIAVEGNLPAIDAARLAATGANLIVIDRADVLGAEPFDEAVREYIEEVARARKTA